MAIDYKKLEQQINTISPAVISDLNRDISKHFEKIGLYFRIFSRCKSSASTIEKLKIKHYEEHGKKNAGFGWRKNSSLFQGRY